MGKIDTLVVVIPQLPDMSGLLYRVAIPMLLGALVGYLWAAPFMRDR